MCWRFPSKLAYLQPNSSAVLIDPMLKLVDPDAAVTTVWKDETRVAGIQSENRKKSYGALCGG